jgi:hypothetical protein
VNTIKVRVAVSAAAAAAIAAGFIAAVSVVETPVIAIPVLPAGLSGALLVTLGFILGRATVTRARRQTSLTASTQQVTAAMVRELPRSQPQVVTPTRVILPVARDGRDSA